jgi:phage portal protein BeeE
MASLLTRLRRLWRLAADEPLEARASSFSDVIGRMDGRSGGQASSGVVVNEMSALRVAAAYACISRIALDVAALPLRVETESSMGTVSARARDAERLFRRPNDWQTGLDFRSMLTAQAVFRGNAYAYKVFDGGGVVRELWPLKATEVRPMWQGGRIVYHVTAYDGKFSGTYERGSRPRGPRWGSP